MVASANTTSREFFALQIKTLFPEASVYQANDGSETLTKINNAPPQVLMMEYELPKLNGSEIANRILKKSQFDKTCVVLISLLPKKEEFLDEIISGRVQFLENPHDDNEFKRVLTKAFNIATGQTSQSEFTVSKVTSGQIFLKEGDPAESVYIVRKGQMKAYKTVDGEEVVLGFINAGEFVGEMSYINGQPRSASVQALSECEVVEVPIGTFDQVLRQRPAWSKALMQTLSKRISVSNEAKPEG